jgi:hypothetical protein
MANGVLPKTMQEPITSLFFFDMVCDSVIDSGVYFRRGAKKESKEEGVLKQVSFPSSLSATHTHPNPPTLKKNLKTIIFRILLYR